MSSFIKITGTFFLLVFLAGSAFGQEPLPFSAANANQGTELEPWLAPVAGYTFSRDALRLSVYSGNLVLDRVGAYVTIEKAFDTDFFTNIYGGTIAVTRHVYVWGGVDVFTKRGVFNSFKRARKEIGLGLTPWKGLVVNAGWSGKVGLTFSAGWKIPVFTSAGSN